MVKLDEHLITMLNDNNYVVGYDNGALTITSSSKTQQLQGHLLPVLAFFSFYIGVNPTGILLLLLLILVPILYDRWRFPKKIVFSMHEESINISKGIILSSSINFREILDLYGEKNELWSDVSAFKEGNKDIIYKIFLSTKSGKVHKLLRLQFRTERDGQISQLTRYLKNFKFTK